MTYTISATLVGANELARGLKKSGYLIKVAMGEVMKKAAYVVQNRAKENAPVMYGQLRGSITHEAPIFTNNNVGAIIGTNVKHARWMEYGTGVYSTDPNSTRQPIRPKTAKVLAWKGRDGKWHHARQIAGVKGKRYMGRAFDETKEEVRRLISAGVDQFLSQVGT